MTIEELLSTCDLKVATEKQFKSCEAFACSNDDLNEFFANDALPYQNYLLGKTYMFCLKSNPNIILSAFTLSNDSIRLTNAVSENDKLYTVMKVVFFGEYILKSEAYYRIGEMKYDTNESKKYIDKQIAIVKKCISDLKKANHESEILRFKNLLCEMEKCI